MWTRFSAFSYSLRLCVPGVASGTDKMMFSLPKDIVFTMVCIIHSFVCVCFSTVRWLVVTFLGA